MSKRAPAKPIILADKVVAMFNERHIPGETDSCWEWSGSRNTKGYGRLKFIPVPGGKEVVYGAHRFSYVVHKGPFDWDLKVCHTCDNPPCVNPKHLITGTHDDNMAYMAAQGRAVTRRGATHTLAKLTDDDVREIRCRLESGETQCRVAAAFGVSQSSIGRLATGASWKHVATERIASLNKSKLTEADVSEIRRRLSAEENLDIRQLAHEFGVGRDMIYLIRRGKSWTHVA